MIVRIRSKDVGDFRGRLLEINLVNYFALKNVPLSYEVKQNGVTGDIDLLWSTNGLNVYIEVKLLGQDIDTKQNEDKQLQDHGFSISRITDDTKDVKRLQYTIIEKATLKKFEYPPAKNNINLIAIDVSELQVCTVDLGDCLLATLGSEDASIYCGEPCARSHVLGLFELNSKPEHTHWVSLVDAKLAGTPHPRDYINGVIFLFRQPTEQAALSYELRACIVWNQNLINTSMIEKINLDFHKIVPFISIEKNRRHCSPMS